MAVQKSRRTRSTRGNRRMHDKLSSATLSIDSETGEVHRRHHLTPNGFYRGKQIIVAKPAKASQDDDSGAS